MKKNAFSQQRPCQIGVIDELQFDAYEDSVNWRG